MRVRESAVAGGGRVLLTSDVTEQKHAQDELEEREQLLETVANGIPLPIAIARISQPEILFANDLATEMFGLRIGPQRDAIRAGYLHPPDRKTLIERLFRDGRVDGFEVRLRRVDGAIMWALLSARAIMIGGQLAMLLTATDITERKAAQVELEEREERFRAIAEGVPLSRPDLAHRPAGDPVRQRPRVRDLRLDGRARARRDPRDLRARRMIGSACSTSSPKEGSVDGFEVEMRGRDGAAMWCLMSARARRLRRPAGGADRDHRRHPAQGDAAGAARRARRASRRSWRTPRSACT